MLFENSCNLRGTTMAPVIWQETFEIRSFEMDFRKRAPIQFLCSLLQETAGNHVDALGIGIETLISQGMTWILSRFHVQVFQYPLWRERIRLETWESDAYSFYALRDFQLFDAQNQAIAAASSLWLILDIRSRHPVRIPDHIVAMRVKERVRAVVDRFDNLWRPATVAVEKRFAVRRSDLDLNQHVNNVRYVEWAVETVPDEVWQTHQLAAIEVSFRAECRYGDEIISHSGPADGDEQPAFIHRMTRAANGQELFLAKTRWQRLDISDGPIHNFQ
jgi:medium-chain acyl-[acyl-carrier-protein] hydrolase